MLQKSVLFDQQIVDAVKEGQLRIEDPGGRPLIDPASGATASDAGLDVHGYLLHVRRIYSWREGKWISLKGGKTYAVKPDEFIITETYEKFSFSRKICGTIHALARLTLQGISHISTTVHPGWGAKSPDVFRIAIKNVGSSSITIRDKQEIARLLFWQGSEPASLLNPPSSDDIFQYMEEAIKAQQHARDKQARATRLLYPIFLTIILIVLMPIILGEPTIADWLKAFGFALIGLWAAYVFKISGLS